MTSIRKIAAAMMLMALAACALPISDTSSHGIRVDQSTMDRFQKGKTTYAEVVQALGQPASVHSMPDGSRIATYTYRSRETGPTVIPGVAVMTAGRGYEFSSATLNFDSNGILKNYTTSHAKM